MLPVVCLRAGTLVLIHSAIRVTPYPEQIAEIQAGISGGTGGPYTFASADLPAGLTMAANGSISGTPTVNGNFTYHVTVTDKDGHTGSITCSVAPPAEPWW